MDDSDDEYAAKSSPPPDDNPELDLMLSRIHSPSSSRDNTQPPTSPTPVGGENSSRGGLTSARGRGQKRPIEDLTQFAESAARNVKLKPAGKNHLIQFSKVSIVLSVSSQLTIFQMTSPQQRLTIAAHLFKVEERQGELPTTQLTEYSLGQRTKVCSDCWAVGGFIDMCLAYRLILTGCHSTSLSPLGLHHMWIKVRLIPFW